MFSNDDKRQSDGRTTEKGAGQKGAGIKEAGTIDRQKEIWSDSKQTDRQRVGQTDRHTDR